MLFALIGFIFVFAFAEIEMNWPAFWAKLIDPATLTALAAFVAIMISHFRQTKALAINTKETIAAKVATEEQAGKVESAVKESQNIVATVADAAAKKVAVNAVAVAEKVAIKAEKTTTETRDILAEVLVAINGRMDKKLELARKEGFEAGIIEGSDMKAIVGKNTDRIARLEKGHDELKLGQQAIINRIDGAMNAILEKIRTS